ncbi:hypothetical protein AAFC00_003631 [Neodothiora populina]|uniref:C2H2-type domain-containing protein n=1 Tax=Neodothiora populina TaxID=2781224 RepID=A0ABR3PG15_9PEZI
MEDFASGEGSSPRGKEKRFGCSFCDRLFARKEHADRHERTHTQEKPFHCPQCESRFTRSDLLVRHERLTHKKDVTDRRAEGSRPAGKKRKRNPPNNNHGEEQNGLLPWESPTLIQRPIVTRPAHSSHSIYRETYPANRDHGHDFLATLSFAAEQAALQDSMAATAASMHSLAEPTTPYRAQTAPHPFQIPNGRPDFSAPGPSASLSTTTHLPAENLALTVHNDPDFEGSLDNLAAFLDNGAFSSNHFSSVISAEQPVPFFSPESLSLNDEPAGGHGPRLAPFNPLSSPSRIEDQVSFSRFGSRLPSLQPEERTPYSRNRKPRRRPLSDLSVTDMQTFADKFSPFASVVSPDCRLPTRLGLSRYLAAYISGFHEHLPFLHIPTITLESCSIELILAMAAVGAQYCFEPDRGVELFHASQAIVSKRLRRRDARLAATRSNYRSSSMYSRDSLSHSAPSGMESYAATPDDSGPEDLMQTAQALLLLMAMATWAKHREILREALAIPSTLATLVRDDGLRSSGAEEDVSSWDEWVRLETVKRTKFIVFCFFNLHCIVYNIPPLILNSELKMILPSSSEEFRASSEQDWREARKKAVKPTTFEDALGRLFVKGGRDITEWNTSLGNYIMIHAIIQHIFFVRQTAKCRYDGDGDLLPEDITALEQALYNWQLGWKRNPESSLDPMDPNGPLAFNSTALLRLAYIRLNIDTGPGRALDSRDPFQIANAFRESPAIKRTPKLVRAVLHSAHALSIPVKIGVRLVAQTQTFIWSIQHSLCSLECAFLLSKWLEALSTGPQPLDPPMTDDEKRIVGLVKTMLDETEFAIPPALWNAPRYPSPLPASASSASSSTHHHHRHQQHQQQQQQQAMAATAKYRHLSAGVLRVWATIFRGAQTWAIVDVIGTSLQIYADMLEGEDFASAARETTTAPPY